ncbi:N-lysine methyltransferase KMT5A-A-like [Echeneis naucrates]|uniref:N-lysine methyltransferase KMT5A-A-like n=1 Tax=Echeneis naucrates TaxID=173247 RepID=UPI001113DAC4|nr:N-lysine methyltransferase KMT5A-A-like [Echeneis naucrates]
MERFIDIFKGRGVFAMHPIEPEDFVLEYRGELFTQAESQSRQYSEIESTFLFDFEWQNCRLCLDASKEDGSLGGLVNDNHKNTNCVMKKNGS